MKHYHKNPRTITKRQMTDLQKWLVEFGDLSGIVHNIPTDEIIGGNQRSEALPGVISGLIQPVITERYDPPLEDGTVCNGYYEIEGRRYQYRGVNWDDKKAERANLIANKAGGTFDMDILANQFDLPVLLDSGFTDFDLGVIQTLNEDEAFDKLPDQDRAPFQQMTFTLHDDQAEQVREAMKLAKSAGAFVDSPNENSNGNALARICEFYLSNDIS